MANFVGPTLPNLINPTGNSLSRTGVEETNGTSPSVGVKAKTVGYTAPTNTLPSQLAQSQVDLSDRYASVKTPGQTQNTIYDTKTHTAFANPDDFFMAAKNNGYNVTPGQFNNLKFNTAYTPPAPESSSTQSASGDASNPASGSSSNATPSTPSPVNQAGIIGSLVNNATNSPAVAKATADIQTLQNQDAQAQTDIQSRPTGTLGQAGQLGVEQNKYALQLSAAQGALQNALAEQAQTTSGLSAAGGLNAPIVTSPGNAIVSPSDTSNSNIVGGNSALNPISQVDTIAQQVINGQLSPQDALNKGGTVSNWASLLNAAETKANGGQPIDTGALQARYDSNQQSQTSQGNLIAQYKSASQQASNLASQFGDLVTKYNLNPNDLNAANGVLQTIAANTSDPRYQTLANYINDITATYAQVLGTGGAATDFKTQLASSFISQLASGTALKQVLASIDQQAQAKIAGISTGSTTNSNNSDPLGLGL